MASTGLRAGAKLSQQTRVDPKIVQASQLVQCTSIELLQAVDAELQANPALERIEESEGLTDNEILESVAPQELKMTATDIEAQRSLPADGLETPNWVDLTPDYDDLSARIEAQMRSSLPKSHYCLAEFFVGSLDDRGYLTSSVEEAALHCDSTLEEAEEALIALKACDPAGIGATDLRESLVLQLRTEDCRIEDLARRILKECWEELIAHNPAKIARSLKASPDAVEAALLRIQSLNPYPGEGIARRRQADSSGPAAASPEIIISLETSGWAVSVPGPSKGAFRIARAFSSKIDQLQGRGTAADERRHLQQFVDRANVFLQGLAKRRQNLLAIGRYLTEHQASYLKTGDVRFLQDLTRTKMAKELGIHESTISRATNRKHLQIATGEIVRFDVLFTPALRIQSMIADILAHENPANPLSDARIKEMLEERGVKIARRTVNKYRSRSRQLSSRMRRSA